MNTSDSGLTIPVNVTTDEEANCSALPGFCNDSGMTICLYFLPINLSNGLNHYADLWIVNNHLTNYLLDISCLNSSDDEANERLFFSINYSCTPNITNTSWGDWENNFSCNINNKVNQTRHKTQYDSNDCGMANQTFYEHRETFCDYCSQNITGPFYNNWSECNDYGMKNRKGYYVDLNFDSCCEVTNLPEDCEILNEYRNFSEEEDCNLTLNIFVKEPSKALYESRRIDFDVNSTLKLEILELIDYFGDNEWEGLCEDCNRYKGSRIFNDGEHNLTLRGRTDGKEAFAFVSFLVDTKYPVIHSMNPRGNRFTNGSEFFVKYTEENCKSVLLEVFGFGGTGNKTESKVCQSGRNKNESFSLNLTKFDNQEVSYQFTVYDLSEKKTRSKFIKVKVDTTSPKINNPDSMLNKTERIYAYLLINVTEVNLDKIQYYDNNDERARWRNLCTRLRNGICEKKIRFQGYSPNLRIRVLDEAGNSVEKEI